LSLSLTVIRVTIEKGELKEGLQEVPKGDMCQGDNSPSQEEKMRDISALRQYSKRL
jgi:hypothetical protein